MRTLTSNIYWKSAAAPLHSKPSRFLEHQQLRYCICNSSVSRVLGNPSNQRTTRHAYRCSEHMLSQCRTLRTTQYRLLSPRDDTIPRCGFMRHWILPTFPEESPGSKKSNCAFLSTSRSSVESVGFLLVELDQIVESIIYLTLSTDLIAALQLHLPSP